MLSPAPALFAAVTFSAIATITSAHLEPRAGCSDNYSKCSPKGASSSDTPAVGTNLSPLYTDLLSSVNGGQNSKRELGGAHEDFSPLLLPRASSASFGFGNNLVKTELTAVEGVDGTQCLLLQGLSLPFCYDNYTTNYFLPGGAHGQIVSGEFTSDSGQANLVSGDFTLSDGTKGNVYGSEDSPDKPNTSTLPIPTQYTASGSISAIAATALGEVITITTTIPGTTVEPSTVAAETIAPSISGTSTVQAASTKPATTIPGSTVAPKTSTFTTTAAGSTATGQGAAGMNTPELGGTTVFGFILFLLFGL
ncbi:MAG: hypothetical protein Q9222_006652 [Ikaeria aurantiellina]